ncbi:MAG: hypothetical protein OZSIB_4374 [Candidatus Ozemobacter sibiricus]|uniref:Uncharacterized protein n=1 Tax=Candidatus Ozemobacter sibiricus TaxID=2268124 RepID=A0A367Z961_9BACT|nr:MAG: hypothetical protein OZSIB_4374 [Candidatus Ozemobacter sibiricus]
MTPTTCPICRSRKGKRHCAVHGALLCSACCGRERGRGLACPDQCGYARTGQAFALQRAADRRLGLLRERLRALSPSDEGIQGLLMYLESVVLRVFYEHPRLNDRDVRMVLDRWLADRQPNAPLLPNEPPPPAPDTPAGQALFEALKAVFTDRADTDPAFARQLERGISRVLLLVIDHHESNNPAAYLFFIRPFIPWKRVLAHSLNEFLESFEEDEEFGESGFGDNDDDDDSEEAIENATFSMDAMQQRALLEEAYDGKIPEQPVDVELLKYEIRHELPIPGMPDYNPPVVKEHPEIRDLIEDDPAAARRQIEEWLQQYPGNAVLTHFLVQVARFQNRPEEAARLAAENYRNHPDYLFARVDQAIELIKTKQLDDVPQVMGGKGFLLPAMYPDRKVFHISELSAVCGVAWQYFLAREKPVIANHYLNILRQVAPDHPLLQSEATHATGLLARLKAAFSNLFGSRPDRARTGTDDQD